MSTDCGTPCFNVRPRANNRPLKFFLYILHLKSSIVTYKTSLPFDSYPFISFGFIPDSTPFPIIHFQPLPPRVYQPKEVLTQLSHPPLPPCSLLQPAWTQTYSYSHQQYTLLRALDPICSHVLPHASAWSCSPCTRQTTTRMSILTRIYELESRLTRGRGKKSPKEHPCDDQFSSPTFTQYKNNSTKFD